MLLAADDPDAACRRPFLQCCLPPAIPPMLLAADDPDAACRALAGT